MLLADWQIRKEIAPGMTAPGERASTFSEGVSGPGIISYGLSSAGYDFRLGDDIRVFTNHDTTVIDPLALDPRAFAELKPRTRKADGGTKARILKKKTGRTVLEYVVIPPNGYILGETVEYLRVPETVLVVVLGKSTYARCGIVVNCTPLEPGWRGRTTLEIGNLSNVPAVVYIGMGIAQALFFRIDGVPEKTYAAKGGKYQDQAGLTLPKA